MIRLASSVPGAEFRRRCVASACVGAFFFWAGAFEPTLEQARASVRAPVRSLTLEAQSGLLIAQAAEAPVAAAPETPSGQGGQPAEPPAASDHASDASLFVLHHDGAVTRVAFGLSGDRFVTSARDGTARIWDALTGAQIGKPLQTLVMVYAAAFDPKGERVVTAQWDKTARIWDAHTGEPIGNPLQHDDVVHTAAFDPKGERIVTASEDKTARIWDAKTGEPSASPCNMMAGSIPPPLTRLASASSQPLRIRPRESGTPIPASLSASPCNMTPMSSPPPSTPKATASSPPPTTRPRASGTPKPASLSESRCSMKAPSTPPPLIPRESA